MSTRFTDHIPALMLTNPNVAQFAALLDAAQTQKEWLIRGGNTFYNPVLLTNINFLIQLVQDYGWPEVPADFPKEVLDNMYLNAQNVMQLRGSKMGLDYWLRVLTCGQPTIDDSKFYPVYDYIILNDPQYGFAFSEDMFPYNMLYLFGDNLATSTQVLTIGIATPYYNLQSLQDYINDNILDFVGFTDSTLNLTITLVDGPRVPNPYANPYFVNNF